MFKSKGVEYSSTPLFVSNDVRKAMHILKHKTNQITVPETHPAGGLSLAV